MVQHIYCLRDTWGLYIFCHNILTTFLPINNIDKKYLLYIRAISYCYYWLELAGAFCGITYYLKTLLKGLYGLHIFCRGILTTFLSINNINKKYLSYIRVISFYCCLLEPIGIFRDIIYYLKALPKSLYRLHTFCRRFLWTSLLSNNIDENHKIYILLISYCSYYLKFVSVFNDIAIVLSYNIN